MRGERGGARRGGAHLIANAAVSGAEAYDTCVANAAARAVRPRARDENGLPRPERTRTRASSVAFVVGAHLVPAQRPTRSALPPSFHLDGHAARGCDGVETLGSSGVCFKSPGSVARCTGTPRGSRVPPAAGEQRTRRRGGQRQRRPWSAQGGRLRKGG